MNFDGKFTFNGDTIFYKMQEEIKTSKSRGRDMMTRFIDYYNLQGNCINSFPCYGVADEMTTITPLMVSKWYEKMLSEQ